MGAVRALRALRFARSSRDCVISRRSSIAMTDPVDALVKDLVEWVGPKGRPYAEAMGAWRTSSPRLPVWEEPNRRGLVQCTHLPGEPAQVVLTAAGLRSLTPVPC